MSGGVESLDEPVGTHEVKRTEEEEPASPKRGLPPERQREDQEEEEEKEEGDVVQTKGRASPEVGVREPPAQCDGVRVVRQDRLTHVDVPLRVPVGSGSV